MIVARPLSFDIYEKLRALLVEAFESLDKNDLL